MAEGARVERACAFQRSLGLANRHIAALSTFRAFRLEGPIGVEPITSCLRGRRSTCLSYRPDLFSCETEKELAREARRSTGRCSESAHG